MCSLEECDKFVIGYACSVQKKVNVYKESIPFFIYIHRFYFNWVQIAAATAFNVADLSELEAWVISTISQPDD